MHSVKTKNITYEAIHEIQIKTDSVIKKLEHPNGIR